MAKRTKKETALTQEEKLQQALVPVEEQPYPVPGNWCWTKVGILSTLHRGVSYKKNDAHTVKGANDCLIMRGGNVGEGFIDIEADNVYVDKKLVADNQFVKNNDIIIVASTGSTKVIGRAGISSSDYSDVAFGAFLMLLRPFKDSLPRYMDLFFQSDLYRNRIRDLASGVNINNIRADYITAMPYPLPPLSEQHRIVARIESLFAKLDEVKEKAQAVVNGYEDRKAAILHKAFTGELTAKWREERRLSSTNWKNTTLGKCVQLLSGQDFKPELYNSDGKGLPYITGASNFDRNHVIINRWTTVPSVIAIRNDVLLVCKGSGYGKTIIADFNEAHIARQIMSLRVKDEILNSYVYFFLQSEYEYLRNSGQGLIPGISRKIVLEMKMSLPELDEQREIVTITEDILKRELVIKFYAQSVLDQIDTMKKSILARAFRGELGTNDPADEPAVELLKKVLEEKS